jgi:pimeloyl-ACP methyl ester carboxylesterase
MAHPVPANYGPRVTFALPGGAAMAYRDTAGSSATESLMLLHGLGVTADLNWGPAYADLGELFRVVAPDLPGHGRGVRPWPGFSLERCADHIVALADSLRSTNSSRVGTRWEVWLRSFSGDGTQTGSPDSFSGATSRNFLGSPVERLFSSLAPAFTVAALANPVLRTMRADALGIGYLNDIDDESRRYLNAEMHLTSMSTVTAAMAAVADFTSHTWIGEIDVPVSILVTQRDTVVPPGRQMKLAEAIPHASVITVDGDHGVFVESPALFARKILEACQAVRTGPTEKRPSYITLAPFVAHDSARSPRRDRRGAYNQLSSRRASCGWTIQVIIADTENEISATRGTSAIGEASWRRTGSAPTGARRSRST